MSLAGQITCLLTKIFAGLQVGHILGSYVNCVLHTAGIRSVKRVLCGERVLTVIVNETVEHNMYNSRVVKIISF